MHFSKHCVRTVRPISTLRHQFQSQHRLLTTGNNRFFRVSEEVQDALSTGKPVVALETTIYTHGYPYPENVALASQLESLVRVNGGIPATIGVLDGVARVGMDAEELIQLISTAGSENTWKLSRRDLGFVTGLSLGGQKLNGGTTIAGTMILAHLAGIKIFATGGLGGVHRGGENSMDISADLTELGRTPVAVVSSGCKSFLDIPRTLEYLETQGVAVATFADGRQGNVDFPAFFSRDSGVLSPRVLLNEADAAAVIHAQSELGLTSGLLFANPVPEEAEIPREQIDDILATAVKEAEEKGITGAANTPYVLKRIKELSKGGSIKANQALIEGNVVRGTRVAVELAKLELRNKVISQRNFHNYTTSVSEPPHPSSSVHASGSRSLNAQEYATKQREMPGQVPIDVLVAGSLVQDTICDYAPFLTTLDPVAPVPETSNPSIISQHAGGVGRNVAVAAHLAGAKVALASAVADDTAGSSLMNHIAHVGLSTKTIRVLKTVDGARTGHYVAVNSTGKDLLFGFADMSIFERNDMEDAEYWKSLIKRYSPKWVVVDTNWSIPVFGAIIKAAKDCGCQVALEPVSTAKAARQFAVPRRSSLIVDTVPKHGISLATPNIFELSAIHSAAQDAGWFEAEDWWKVIDRFGLSSSGSTDRITAVTSRDIVNQGVPQRSIQLLPFIPNLVVKLGARGCLLASVLRAGDSRVSDPEYAPFMLSRSDQNQSGIGGVYMRLFPPSELVSTEDVVSVNGVGDTMLGVIMAGLVRGKTLQEVIPMAQRAATLTLRSSDAVSPDVASIQKLLG